MVATSPDRTGEAPAAEMTAPTAPVVANVNTTDKNGNRRRRATGAASEG
jgi:hypothetical protein